MTHSNSQPLDPETLTQFWDTMKLLGEHEQKILNRINYIIHQIHAVFDSIVHTWYFPDEDLAATHLRSKIIWGYNVEASGYDEEMLILLDGKIWGLEEFPARWLTEPFEQELKDGRAAYLAKVAKKKAAAIAAKEEKEAAKQAALQKLSPEDRKLLGLDK